jgi:hypothetical protein
MCLVSPLYAQSLHDSVDHAFAQDQQPSAQPVYHDGMDPHTAKTLKWVGLGMAMTGSTLAILSWTALKVNECSYAYAYNHYGYAYDYECTTHTNWPIAIAGWSLAGTGIVLETIGNSHLQAQVSPNKVGVSYSMPLGKGMPFKKD